MEDIWDQLLDQLAEYDIDLEEALNPGAGEHEIIDTETKLKIKFPLDFIEFYKIYNGQDEMSDNLIYGHELLSFNRIIAEWKIWKQLFDKGNFNKNGKIQKSSPDKGIKDDWWNPMWIPFTYDGSGNHYCLDLDPTDDGHIAQIIQVSHDEDKRLFVAKSFKEFIEKYINDLKTGKFVIDL
ncbi:MAG: SMI1/KNR4 family protein [Bacteroidales bacterium]|nr:SMI1/KNR4 family protein [Bacteroidales bacterium]